MTPQPLSLTSRLALPKILRLRGAPPMVRAVAAVFFALVVLTAGQTASQEPKPEQTKPEEAKAEPAKPAVKDYATSITCQGCHEDIYNAFFKRNPHRALETVKW
jgi:hypothetical protein